MDDHSVESSSSGHHKRQAQNQGPISIGLVTVSDTRTAETDANYQYLEEKISQLNHHITQYSIVQDEPSQIEKVLQEFIDSKVRVIIFNGGTGVSKRDTTFDVINTKLEKVLPGFGEIFRMISYNDIGSAAMLSRAVAGIYKNTIIFSIPGSPQAVKLAWEQLIQKELHHLAWEVLR